MSLIYQFRRLAFAQVLLGIVAFCLAAQNPGMLLVAGSIGALAWYVTEGPNGRPLPRWVTNIGALAAVAWMLVELFAGEGGQQPVDMVVAMGHFTMWLQILLLYSEKTNREYAQVLVLSVLQMIAASVLSVSMVYGVILAAYCVLALVTVLLFHFKSTSDKVLEHNRAAATEPSKAIRPKPVVGRGHRWHFRFMTVAVGLMCTAVAVAVFVISPRADDTHNPITARDASGRTEAGFSQQVSTRSSPGSRGGREPVLNVRFYMHEMNIGGENRPPWLLRGAALDQYNQVTQAWSRSRSTNAHDFRLSLPSEGVTLVDLPENTPTIEAHVTLRQLGHNVLFTHHLPSFVQSSSLAAVGFNAVDQQLTSEDASGALVYTVAWPVAPQENVVERYREQVGRHASDSEMLRQARDSQLFESFDRDYARGWPVQRGRVTEYTQALLAEHGLSRDPEALHTDDDAAIARVLTDYFREGFTYKLTNPDVPDHQDPVIQFLFDHRSGHCELFASGLAAMARSIGMQARVVTGYVASEYNPVGGYYVVRQRNAHAWVEINTGPGQTWRTFDPTPPADLAEEHRPRAGWRMVLRQLYDHAEFAWIRSVVAFDQRSRQAVMDGIQHTIQGGDEAEGVNWLKEVGEFFRDLPDYWRLDRISWTIAGLIVVAIGICLAYLARLLVLRRQRLVALQLTALPRAKRRGLARRLRFYLTMLDMLERHGYHRPSWQSPFSFAQELAEANPMRFDPVVALTEIFYEIRFGHRELDGDRKRRISAHLKQLEHALVRTRG
ncbi:DUF3488 and DUF4129 domain-containing transglutaminase family protein [Phycisphaerales bacterium AB-hyl4]|uniref:DUF3488 and DUF4129 domain-containing transglutaminase family protein n=1 Tax=Natronomicrosphaera hydrolytica TaxID=3242702 RepID=A0ABV4U9F6_9BACT